MAASSTTIATGFSDPARDAQAVFRQVMTAMSRPCTPQRFERAIATAPAPLSPIAAAVVLTLADFETPLWLDAPLAASADVCAFVDFHAGAPRVADPASATFAVAADPARLPALAAFALGTPEYPDRSTTLILQVAGFGTGRNIFAGPGLEHEVAFDFAPEPADFAGQWRANRALFPRGVDIVFASDSAIAALPRSTRLKDL